MGVISAALLTANEGTSASSFNTVSITPSPNKIILAFVGNSLSPASNTPSLSGNSLTWAQVGSTVSASNEKLSVWRAMGSAPTAGVVTISFAGQSQSLVTWAIVELGLVDQSGTNGSGAIVQSNSNVAAFPASSPFSVGLSSFTQGNNATIGAFYINGVTTITKGANFSEVSNHIGSHTLEVEFATDNQTAVDWTYTGNSQNIAVAIEIKAGVQGGALFGLI